MYGLSPDERRVFDHLMGAIAERRLAPGVRLTEAELAETFGLSRARIRKVLLALSQFQLIRHEPNRGAHVTRLSPREARDVMEARLLIEPEIARRAASVEETDRAAMAGRLSAHVAEERAAAAGRRHAESIRLSGRFHGLLCEMIDNAVLGDILDRLLLLSILAIATNAPTASDQCGIDEHERLVRAIAAGDADRAAALMRDHLDGLALMLREMAEADEAPAALRA
jgi:DNA-binding GntR family transcriptional regulator